ncbi:hypothetical protein [Paenibacillus sp. 32352]|uniref:hypothetical protein n=1 Tax=Paenibacillus sp. 32352 TaxID=1969111 RepID=UPI0009ACA487|nr:hypothetical protein [Paenibacillus sp. 32352]
MKRIRLITVVILLSFSVIAAGCGKKEHLSVKKLSEFYNGDISKVDTIEITDGSSGKRKSFTDREQVQAWIDSVRHIELIPDPNQEDRSGFLYAVSLFENKELKLGFTPNSIGGHYYIHNDEMKAQIEQLLRSKN